MFLDGGVRRGTDVFKALALGASGIFVSTMPFNSYSNIAIYCISKKDNSFLLPYSCQHKSTNLFFSFQINAFS